MYSLKPVVYGSISSSSVVKLCCLAIIWMWHFKDGDGGGGGVISF